MLEPESSGWIVPAVLAVVMAGIVGLVAVLVPDSHPLFGVAYLCPSGLGAVCLLAFVARFLQWYVWVKLEMEQKRADARSTTPLLRAAQAVRELTPEQAALIPVYMPGELQIVYVDQEGTLEPYFEHNAVKIPWDFIEEFLLKSDNVYLMNINSTSDKTPARIYAQAMTDYLIAKRWAVPATGPHPAMWRENGRERAARLFQVKLRSGVGYVEPEEQNT